MSLFASGYRTEYTDVAGPVDMGYAKRNILDLFGSLSCCMVVETTNLYNYNQVSILFICGLEHLRLGLQSCEMACAVEHSGSKTLFGVMMEKPVPRRRLYVEQADGYKIPMVCRHCEDAPCVIVCRTGAMSQDAITRVGQQGSGEMRRLLDVRHDLSLWGHRQAKRSPNCSEV